MTEPTRKHGKKGGLTLRFTSQNRTQTARTGVQLAFIAGRQFCRWTTDARNVSVIKH